MPNLECLDGWKDYSSPINPALNTADLCYNTAVFFPVSSIPAYDGTKYIGVDCQQINSEYVQVQLNQVMVAGTSYCVSFYASVCDQSTSTSSLGARFSVSEITVNPYTVGMSAHVQGAVPFDPTIWTKITGTYTATGGERFMTLGGFQNTATNFAYMYIDKVEVYPMLPLNLGVDQPICVGQVAQLNATPGATSYLWSTGDVSSSITVSSPGEYWVEQVSASCSLFDTVMLFNDSCGVFQTDEAFYIPNAFTPNGDGVNDLFGAVGIDVHDFEISIFNRWGELIFTSTNLQDHWDGKYQQRDVAQSVYVYKLSFRKNDRFIYLTGHVVLIR
ncbi:MAG: gliding motility-associated C-terminal domain-containing protein [Bacteroidia bacterium]|nr:gliding motility-associated C-terminal domain-containing protein [Bacteroidia bacterium]